MKNLKSNLPHIITALLVVCAAVVAVMVRNHSDNNAESYIEGTINNMVIDDGEYLIIPAGDVGKEAVFYPIEVDGVEMEIFAVRASDGTIRTAFNTCQSCYRSGAGYYVQEDDDLVCQNCGFHFTPDQVEVVSGGCNPWPIFDENKTVTDDTIQISYDFLQESLDIFSNWKL